MSYSYSNHTERDVDPPTAFENISTVENSIDTYSGRRMGLPPEKSFPIQIGAKLYRLSGVSIMSDGELHSNQYIKTGDSMD